MTITTQQSEVTVQGNGSTTVFPYTFLIPNANEAVISLTDSSENITILNQSTFSISGIGTSTGGSVTYPLSGSPIPLGTSLTISRFVPYLQQTSLSNQGGYYPAVVESALDYLTMQCQQLNTLFTSSVQSAINTVINAGIFASNYGASLIGFMPQGIGAVVTTVSSELRQVYRAVNFTGVDATGVTDSSAGILAACIASANADLVFAPGNYSFYLDISSGVLPNPPKSILGAGNVTFHPFSAAPVQSSVIYCNNNPLLTPGFMEPVATVFRNIVFTGRKLGTVDPVYGDVNYAVELLYSSGIFYDCSFMYGKVAGFYSLFGQYNEFYNCSFGANVNDGTAIGCFLNSSGDRNSANENKFYSCKFNTNSVGLKILGGLQNKIFASQFQSNGVGIVLGADATGFGTESNLFSGCYFEMNTVDIQGGICVGQKFDACCFVSSGSASTFAACYDLIFNACVAYAGTTITINHPAANADVASLTWLGNNFDPVLNLAHSGGKIRLNMASADTGLSQNLNVFNTTSSSPDLAPYLTGQQFGYKKLIPLAVSTPLFTLTQDTVSVLRYMSFKLTLQCVIDDFIASSFGYCSRLETFQVFISNNTSGLPHVFTSTLAGGIDLGLNPAFAAIGAITLTTVVVGQNIQFNITWNGAGTNPLTFGSISCGYILDFTGTGPTTLVNL